MSDELSRSARRIQDTLAAMGSELVVVVFKLGAAHLVEMTGGEVKAIK